VCLGHSDPLSLKTGPSSFSDPRDGVESSRSGVAVEDVSSKVDAEVESFGDKEGTGGSGEERSGSAAGYFEDDVRRLVREEIHRGVSSFVRQTIHDEMDVLFDDLVALSAQQQRQNMASITDGRRRQDGDDCSVSRSSEGFGDKRRKPAKVKRGVRRNEGMSLAELILGMGKSFSSSDASGLKVVRRERSGIAGEYDGRRSRR